MKQLIDVTQVASVYSGKDGYCCCGCSGKHTYASAHRDWAGKNRGYPVTADEVNDRTVKLITKKINAGIEDADFEMPVYVSLVVGKRLYIAYLKDNCNVDTLTGFDPSI